LRLLKLSEKPLCETCNKPAVLVDHIKPITLDNTELFFDYNNLQSLCDSCHRIKTRKDNSRFSKLEAGKILQKQMEND
jgi:5-methylcytosine-specific restriction endonuclease McrA